MSFRARSTLRSIYWKERADRSNVIFLALVFLCSLIFFLFLWANSYQQAKRELRLLVDARGVESFSLVEPDDSTFRTFDLHYPNIAGEWDIRIETLGEANPASYDAQIWLIEVATPVERLNWDEATLTGTWERKPPAHASQGDTLVAYGKEPRTVEGSLTGSRLSIKFGKHGWTGHMRVTINGESRVIDTWAPEYSVAEETWEAPPSEDDVIEGQSLSTYFTLEELSGTSTLKLDHAAGNLKVNQALLDGRPIRFTAQELQLPSRFSTIYLPSICLAACAAFLATILVWALMHLIRKNAFWSVVALVVAVKFWLISGDEIRASLYDGRGYMLSALKWHWGQEFGLHNFERQPVYPLFIALTDVLGIPLRISLELFYLGACLLLATCLPKYGISRWAGLAAFAVMAFHPLTVSVLAFAYQDVAYAPLLLISLGGLLHATPSSGRQRWSWLVVASVGIALTWNTRPERILLVALLVVAAAVAFLESWNRHRQFLRAIAPVVPVVLLPLLFAGMLTAVFAGLGRTHMGEFAVSNFQLKGFSNLYKELLAIDPETPERYMPVPREVREKAYAVSPTFRELQPILEGPALDYYRDMVKANTGVENDYSVFFFWGLRLAPWYMKKWETAGELDRFYGRAAEELAAARAAGAYEARWVPAGYIDPAVHLWLPALPDAVMHYWKILASADVIYLHPEDEGVEPEIFDKAANRRAAAAANNTALWTAQQDPHIAQVRAAGARLSGFLTQLLPIVLPAALILLLKDLYYRRSRQDILLLGLFTLLLYVFLSRLLLVSIMHAVAFEAETRYIFPVAPLAPFMVVLCFATLGQAALAVTRNKWQIREFYRSRAGQAEPTAQVPDVEQETPAKRSPSNQRNE